MVSKHIILVLGAILGFVGCGKAPESKDTNTEKQLVAVDTVNKEQPLIDPDTTTDHSLSKSQIPGFGYYYNTRYDYSVDYPDSFNPQPEATNGDGRVFVNLKDSAFLTVYGTRGVDLETEQPLSLRQNYDRNIQRLEGEGSEVTYSKLGNGFYVLSGYKQGHIFYQKTIITKDEMSGDPSFAYAIAEYPISLKEKYATVCSGIFKSFEAPGR